MFSCSGFLHTFSPPVSIESYSNLGGSERVLRTYLTSCKWKLYKEKKKQLMGTIGKYIHKTRSVEIYEIWKLIIINWIVNSL